MSTPHADVVDDADRLARVKLSSAIEPGDLGLVSELGAVKVLDYLEAARTRHPHHTQGRASRGPRPVSAGAECRQEARVPAKTCQASADLAVRLSRM